MKKLSYKNFAYISFVILFTFCVVIVLYILTEKNKEKYVSSFVLMDKKFSQIIYGKNCEHVTSLVKNEVSKIEEILSCDLYGSDIEKINSANCKWVKVNDITIDVLQKLVGIFYYVKKDNPTYLNLFKNSKTLENIDCNLIKIDEKLKRVKLDNENVQISINDAIEGAVCNKAIEIYKEEKISEAIVQFGNTTGYLNCIDSDVSNGFTSEYKNISSNEYLRFFHPSDAIMSCILSKLFSSMNNYEINKMTSFFI